MADISFIVLIFFLMVTTMDKEMGLARRLPQMPDPNQKVEDTKVNRRNLLLVKVNANDRVFAGDQVIVDMSQLRDQVIEFLDNPQNKENLSEKSEKEIEGFGTCLVSKGVISLQNDRGTSYSKYIEVQNELVRAVNELRDRFSMANFGKKYVNLPEDQQKIVRDAVPQQISEAEPKDTGVRR